MSVSDLLVTGGNGFVGRALVRRALQEGLRVSVAVRNGNAKLPEHTVAFQVGDIDGQTDWRNALHGVTSVVHCAARVHQIHESSAAPLDDFRKVNTTGSLNLMKQATQAGVKRFVFVSTVGVNGAKTCGTPFTAADTPAPHSPYAVSKYEAEEQLKKMASASGIDLVVVRPPMVFGPGAPGNFERLLRLVSLGFPLPLGAIDNRRSFISVDNLVQALLLCVMRQNAAGKTLLVSDGHDISTRYLVQRMAYALGCRSTLVPVPPWFLFAAARMVRRSETAHSLIDSLQIDNRLACDVLMWRPRHDFENVLRASAVHFLQKY